MWFYCHFTLNKEEFYLLLIEHFLGKKWRHEWRFLVLLGRVDSTLEIWEKAVDHVMFLSKIRLAEISETKYLSISPLFSLLKCEGTCRAIPHVRQLHGCRVELGFICHFVPCQVAGDLIMDADVGLQAASHLWKHTQNESRWDIVCCSNSFGK